LAVSVAVAVRVCVPLIESGPKPLLDALVAVIAIEVTGQVTNGTEGLLMPAAEAEMLTWPVPMGVTVPAVAVPVLSIMAMVVSLLDHVNGLTPVTPVVKSAVISHGAVGGVFVLQTVGSLLIAAALNCGSDALGIELTWTPNTVDNDVQVQLALVAHAAPLAPIPG